MLKTSKLEVTILQTIFGSTPCTNVTRDDEEDHTPYPSPSIRKPTLALENKCARDIFMRDIIS